MRGTPLARLLLLVYLALVAYASLYPLSGWRDHGGPWAELLAAPWPRAILWFDVLSNVIGYAVLGFLAVLAMRPRVAGFAAVLAAAVGGAVLSALMEGAQSYLPARTPSSLDLLCNAAGAIAGALAGLLAGPWEQPLRDWRARALLPGAQADLGLALLGLWLFTQLNPAMLLFGVGDLRDLLAGPAGPARAPELFVAVEAVTAAANLAAVALLASAIAVPGAPVRVLVVALVLAALAVKTFAFAVILRAQDGFAWMTPGALQGLVAGLAVALLAVGLPRVARLAMAAVLLMIAAILVNLAPQNPYMAAMLKLWQQGHFLNFNGLTRLVATLWPFAALSLLIHLAARRRDDALRVEARPMSSYYERHVFFCCNQRDASEPRPCCNGKGASEMRDYAKKRVKELGLAGEGKVRVNQAGCLDRCEEGPCVVVYPEAVWYTYVDRHDIDEIVEEHLRHGRPVERLRI